MMPARTVLVVDDSIVQRSHLAGLLRAAGFTRVLEAEDGCAALQVLEHGAVGPAPLVLTDLDMPRMDGLQLIRHLSERNLAAQLIVVSARDPRILEIVERMDTGALVVLGTLPKPARAEELALLLAGSGNTPEGSTGGAAGPETRERIEQGLRAGEFIPWYQPKVATATGVVAGVEALARWMLPDGRVQPPASFLRVIEDTALLGELTLVIARQALARLRTWHAAGLRSLTMSINLSAVSLANRELVAELEALVEELELPPQAVIREITETAKLDGLADALGNAGHLALRGFGLAMDDYGTGYSNLQQLSRCPFTELKIDRSFVDRAVSRPNRRLILEAAVATGQRLGVTTVAEGVESRADWALLRALGCELAQGYLIARAMPGPELLPWVAANRTRLDALARDG